MEVIVATFIRSELPAHHRIKAINSKMAPRANADAVAQALGARKVGRVKSAQPESGVPERPGIVRLSAPKKNLNRP